MNFNISKMVYYEVILFFFCNYSIVMCCLAVKVE